MTDGKRLVWATIYALAFACGGDALAAARAVEQLRKTAQRHLRGGQHAFQIDERNFLDEIVSVPCSR